LPLLLIHPEDYHRIILPIEGKLTDMLHVPVPILGQTHNGCKCARVVARNETCCDYIFDTPVGKVAILLVWVRYVASMRTVWSRVTLSLQQENSATPGSMKIKILVWIRGMKMASSSWAHQLLFVLDQIAVELPPTSRNGDPFGSPFAVVKEDYRTSKRLWIPWWIPCKKKPNIIHITFMLLGSTRFFALSSTRLNWYNFGRSVVAFVLLLFCGDKAGRCNGSMANSVELFHCIRPRHSHGWALGSLTFMAIAIVSVTVVLLLYLPFPLSQF